MPARLDPAVEQRKADGFDVTIYRDNWGVPHIYGKQDVDVAFGLGFAHMEDDWETTQEVLAMSRGTLAKYKGKQAAQTDYLIQFFRVWDLVETRYDTDLPLATRAMVEAYADGINSYAAKHPNKVWRGLFPVTGKDVVAGFVFRTPFFFGIERDLAKIFDPNGFIDQGPKETTFELLTNSKAPVGSNAIAVAPNRSADGATRLLVNSHQPFAGPVAWYEVRLKSDEGWDMAGGVFPGSPVIFHGHNQKLGWASTVNAPDLVDVYKLTLNPDNDKQYLLDGAWRDFEISEAPLRVKLFGPFSWVFKRDVIWSEHGPVFNLDHGAFAIRHAGMDEIRQVHQFYKLNKAHDFEAWRDAMRINAQPSINYVYADAEGNIAYLYNARMPDRDPKYDWKGLLPGDQSDAIWSDYVPFEALPFLVNPDAGFVINANNTPFRATAPDGDMDPERFPKTFGIETSMTNRAYRALELFGADIDISGSEFLTYKFDNKYSASSELVALVEELVSIEAESDSDLATAQVILRAWTLTTEQEDEQAALAILTGGRVLGGEEKIETVDDKVAVLLDVASMLRHHFGSLEVSWGDINRLRRGDVDLGLSGGPDTLRAIYAGYELDNDNKLTAMAGDTLIYFVEWDSEGRMSSRSIHQFGSATLDKMSVHYDDQTVLFAEERLKPVLFDFEDLEPEIKRAYRPGE